MKLSYGCVEHAAVYTIDDMRELDFPENARIAKNLFLRDAKGKRHFLVVVDADQPVDLKALEGKLGSTKLSFASDERLKKHLGLEKGAVSPLGLVNDTGHAVEVYVDQALRHCDAIGIHPNDNTATVFLSCKDLLAFAEKTGHEISFIRP